MEGKGLRWMDGWRELRALLALLQCNKIKRNGVRTIEVDLYVAFCTYPHPPSVW